MEGAEDARLQNPEAIVFNRPNRRWAFLSNSLSLGMLAEWDVSLEVQRVDVQDLRNFSLYSIVGHESTARLYGRLLGLQVSMNRQPIEIRPGDMMVVGQIKGRLPEGKVLTDEEMGQYPLVWLLVKVTAR